MLVLSRKADQQIRIGNDITITVLKVSGRGVRIGIEAPSGVRVLRAELKDKAADSTDAAGHESPAPTRPTTPASPQSPQSLMAPMSPMAPASSRVKNIAIAPATLPKPLLPASPRTAPGTGRGIKAREEDASADDGFAHRATRGDAPSPRREASLLRSPRCRVSLAGVNSPGRHPLRVGPASAAISIPRPWDGG